MERTPVGRHRAEVYSIQAFARAQFKRPASGARAGGGRVEPAKHPTLGAWRRWPDRTRRVDSRREPVSLPRVHRCGRDHRGECGDARRRRRRVGALANRLNERAVRGCLRATRRPDRSRARPPAEHEITHNFRSAVMGREASPRPPREIFQGRWAHADASARHPYLGGGIRKSSELRGIPCRPSRRSPGRLALPTVHFASRFAFQVSLRAGLDSNSGTSVIAGTSTRPLSVMRISGMTESGIRLKPM